MNYIHHINYKLYHHINYNDTAQSIATLRVITHIRHFLYKYRI